MTCRTEPSAFKEFQVSMDWQKFRTLVDGFIRRAFEQQLRHINAHAGALWIPHAQDGTQGLMIAVNVGDRGAEIEGKIFQPLQEGLVCKAYLEDTVVCPQGWFRPRDQSQQVDKQLRQVTAHQIAAPLKMFGVLVGAVTAIQSVGRGTMNQREWGFEHDDIDSFTIWVEICQRLLEYRFLNGSV